MKQDDTRQGLCDAIARIEEMRADARRSQIEYPVITELRERLGDEWVEGEDGSEVLRDRDEVEDEDEAEKIVYAMSDDELEAKYEEIAQSYWESADWEKREWLVIANGQINAFKRALYVLECLLQGIEPEERFYR